MICSDFHPFTKISDILGLQQPTMSYFSTDIFEGEMAHARFYDEEIRKQIPKCHYRKYTISEIINSIIGSGFTLERFDEHPSWENEKLPSVREFAAEVEVNVNTVARSFEWLQNQDVVATRRGLGNFVNEGAREAVLNLRKREFFDEQVPEFFRTMKALGVTLEEIISYNK